MPRHRTTLLLAAWLLVAPVWANDKGPRPMDALRTLTQRLSALDDAVYARRDETAVANLPLQAAELDFRGLALGAPRAVQAASGRPLTLNALLLTGTDPARAQSLDWHANAMLVAVDIDRDQVFTAPAFRTDPSKSPAPRESDAAPPVAPTKPAPPSAIPPPPAAATVGLAWLDAAGLLGLSARSARLQLRLIAFDQTSNPALVEVRSDQPGPSNTPMPDALSVMGRLAAAGQSADGLPVFKRTGATPGLAQPGVVFALGGGARPAVVHAALKLELSAPMILGPAPGPAPSSRPLPSALVRANLLVVHRNRAQAHVVPVSFPVWSPRPPRVGETIEAAFSIDLASHLPAAALPAGAQVYLQAGRHWYGPRTLGR